MLIHTLIGDRDESTLIKTEGLIDNENERTQIVEYCVVGCDGQAHRTGQPDAIEYFCSQHVHRSVAMHLKQGLNVAGIAGGLG